MVADLAVGVVAAGARRAGRRAREVAALLAAAALGVSLALVVAALQRRALVARQARARRHQVDDVTARVAAARRLRAQLLCEQGLWLSASSSSPLGRTRPHQVQVLTGVHAAAAADGVAGVLGRARAHRDVVAHLAVGVDAAGAGARVHALVVLALAVVRAVAAVCKAEGRVRVSDWVPSLARGWASGGGAYLGTLRAGSR